MQCLGKRGGHSSHRQRDNGAGTEANTITYVARAVAHPVGQLRTGNWSLTTPPSVALKRMASPIFLANDSDFAVGLENSESDIRDLLVPE